MSLSNIFTPQSIAVIGASTQEGSVGNSILKNLLSEYQGQVFPINPKNNEILKTPCFASVLDLDIVPDLAIIVVPAKVVPIVLQQVADKGVKGVVIISAGFREVGGEGVNLEEKIKEICVANNISLIGPNCLGVINPWINMNGSFANSLPPKGNIAFLSQSGAICTAVIDYAHTLGLGFSKFVSVGNKALCSEVEMLKYLQQDEQTEVIAIYAEGLSDANLIIETMKTITKPVVILKSGRTAAGGGASSSHTGALASEDILYETLFRQAGIIRANTIEELFDFMQVLSKYGSGEKLIMKSEKLQVAIITNAGGPGVLTTDFVIQNRMELAKISETSLQQLKLVLPPTANFHNPIDLIGDAPAQRYHDALDVLCQDENVDVLIVILTPQTTTQIDETANYISKAVCNCKKPIVVSFIGGDKVLSGVKILRQNKVVHINFPENAARALSVLNSEKLKVKSEKLEKAEGSKSPLVGKGTARFPCDILSVMGVAEKLTRVSLVSDLSNACTRSFATLKVTNSLNKQKKAQAIFAHYKAKNQNYIPEVDAKTIFECYNVPTVKSVFCKDVVEVKELVDKTFEQLPIRECGNVGVSVTSQNQTKLILKIISPDVIHKSDVGGITANVLIENAEMEFVKMMKVVQSKLPNARLEGVLFSQMVDLSSGVEFILGAKKDPSLGMVIMFGLGGTMVELIHDVVFGFGRLEKSDILEMIKQLKSKKIIEGYRGKSPLDLEAIILTIQGLSNLLADFSEITEVDMNPILVGYNESGAKVLDAKIVFD
jgi:acetate---CoA ligase (ADP-forming)